MVVKLKVSISTRSNVDVYFRVLLTVWVLEWNLVDVAVAYGSVSYEVCTAVKTRVVVMSVSAGWPTFSKHAELSTFAENVASGAGVLSWKVVVVSACLMNCIWI